MKIHYFLLQFYKIKSAGVLWTVTNAQTCGSFKRHQSKKKKKTLVKRKYYLDVIYCS